MKKIRRLICFLLAAVLILSLILSIGTAALAATLPEGKAETCSITISLIDQSLGFSDTSIQVNFKSETEEKKITLDKDQSWGIGQVVTIDIPAPAEYALSFEGLQEGYTIINTLTNGKPESKFKVQAAGNKEFYWAIIEKSAVEQANKPMQPNTAITDRENVTINNEEAEKVYTEFLSAVAFIETDPSWYNGLSALLNQYGEDSFNRDLYSQWYADYVRGGTKAKYFEMSAFEQFLWTESYTRLANAINSEWGYDYFFANEKAFANAVTDLVTATMTGNNSETVKEAYLNLMDWQYNYIMKYNEPFNFINSRSYREETRYIGGNQQTVEETTAATKEIPDETEEEKGVWDDTFRMLANNALSVICLIVLGGVIFVIHHIRKIKNC